MVCLEKLDRSDFEEVYRIMEQSFPADERRKKEGQQKLLDEEKYELLGVRNEGGLLAFLAVWEFAEFVFIEHFAVSEKARNSVSMVYCCSSMAMALSRCTSMITAEAR